MTPAPPRLDPWDWLLLAAMAITALPIAARLVAPLAFSLAGIAP